MADLTHLIAQPREQTSEPYPCMVLLHGRGSNEADLFGLVPQLPDQLFVVSVRAPFSMSFSAYYWYETEAVGKPRQESFEQSLGMLGDFISNLPNRYPVDPRRIILGGFSQGGMMSGYLTLSQPALVAGAVILSGYLPEVKVEEDRAGCKGKPVFMAHGAHDSVLPLTWGQASRLHLEEVGLDVEYHEYPMDHQVIPAEIADLQGWLGRQLAQ